MKLVIEEVVPLTNLGEVLSLINNTDNNASQEGDDYEEALFKIDKLENDPTKSQEANQIMTHIVIVGHSERTKDEGVFLNLAKEFISVIS